MKKIIALLFPIIIFGQNDQWSISIQSAMKDIENKNYKSAITNLNKSLEIVPKNWSALYFKGYSLIIIGENDKGCSSLIDAIYYGGNDDTKKLYSEKCIDYNPKLNSNKFKTGKFSLQILNDSLVYYFERSNEMQHETYDGKIYSGKITWFENGDYTIVPTDETKKYMSDNPQFVVRILKIENNEYLYEKIEENQVQYGIIKKIE